MKKLFCFLTFFITCSLAQESSSVLRTRLPERASWQINYFYHDPLIDFLKLLGSSELDPNAPKDVTTKMKVALRSGAEDAREGKLQYKVVSKNKKNYYEAIAYEDARRSKTRYILNQDYGFAKRSNFPRYMASGKGAFKDSIYKKSDFPAVLEMQQKHYKGDVLYNQGIYQVFAISDAEQEVDRNRLILAWLTTHGGSAAAANADPDNPDESVSVELPSEAEMKADLFGDRMTVVLVNKSNKRPLFVCKENKVMQYDYTVRQPFPALPNEIVTFVENNAHLLVDRKRR